MKVIRTITELRRSINELQKRGQRIGFVPTMGALHLGHRTLIREAAKKTDAVVVSIFVNPTQFGPKEDFNRYPRPEAQDLQILEEEKVSIAYLPTVEEMYPQGFKTNLEAGVLGNVLDGTHRPGHFDGVVTVVKKLFDQVKPDIAFFGEKDYQQLCVIKSMVKEQNLPLKITSVPTVREKDGLALSSRNMYLTPEERARAPLLYGALQDVAKGTPTEEAIATLEREGFKVDYFEIRDAETLALSKRGRIFVAAKLGNTRLIDNIVTSI